MTRVFVDSCFLFRSLSATSQVGDVNLTDKVTVSNPLVPGPSVLTTHHPFRDRVVGEVRIGTGLRHPSRVRDKPPRSTSDPYPDTDGHRGPGRRRHRLRGRSGEGPTSRGQDSVGRGPLTASTSPRGDTRQRRVTKPGPTTTDRSSGRAGPCPDPSLVTPDLRRVVRPLSTPSSTPRPPTSSIRPAL